MVKANTTISRQQCTRTLSGELLLNVWGVAQTAGLLKRECQCESDCEFENKAKTVYFFAAELIRSLRM